MTYFIPTSRLRKPTRGTRNSRNKQPSKRAPSTVPSAPATGPSAPGLKPSNDTSTRTTPLRTSAPSASRSSVARTHWIGTSRTRQRGNVWTLPARDGFGLHARLMDGSGSIWTRSFSTCIIWARWRSMICLMSILRSLRNGRGMRLCIDGIGWNGIIN